MFKRKPIVVNNHFVPPPVVVPPASVSIPAAPKPTPRSVVVVDLYPDDIVVLACDGDLAPQEAQAIKEAFEVATPAKAVVLTGDLRLDAVLHQRPKALG